MPSYSTWSLPGSLPRGDFQTVLAGDLQRVNAFDRDLPVGWKQAPELETAVRIGLGASLELSLKMRWLVGPSLPEVGLRYQLNLGRWHLGLAPSFSYHEIRELDEVEDLEHQWQNEIWQDMDATGLAVHLPLLLSRWFGDRHGVGLGPRLLYQRERYKLQVLAEERESGLAAGAYLALFSRITAGSTLVLEGTAFPLRDRRIFQHHFWQVGVAWVAWFTAPVSGQKRFVEGPSPR